MTWLEAFKKQGKSIFKVPGLMILLFIGPIFLILFMGGVYVNPYVNDIPIAVLDEDGSPLSRQLISYFRDDDRFELVAYPESRAQMQTMIEEGTVHGGLWLPKDFSEDVTGFQGGEILFIVDGTNLVVANNAYAQATSIIQTISAGVEIKLLEGKGMTPLQSERIAKVFNIGERLLYDSKLTYMNYLILPFFAVFFQQLYLSAMGSMLIRDQGYLVSNKSHEKIFGAALSIIVAFIPAALISGLIVVKGYHVPIQGNSLLAIGMMIVYLLSLSGPAMIIASVVKDRTAFSQFSFMLSLPTFVSSGAVWPVDQMPVLFKSILQGLWPLVHFAKPFQEVLIKGRGLGSIWQEILGIILYGSISFGIGLYLYKRRYGNDLASTSKQLCDTDGFLDVEGF